MEWEQWKAQMRVSIAGASIARQAHDKMAQGRGAPDEEDMKRYAEEAGAIADLWASTLPE